MAHLLKTWEKVILLRNLCPEFWHFWARPICQQVNTSSCSGSVSSVFLTFLLMTFWFCFLYWVLWKYSMRSLVEQNTLNSAEILIGAAGRTVQKYSVWNRVLIGFSTVVCHGFQKKPWRLCFIHFPFLCLAFLLRHKWVVLLDNFPMFSHVK